MPRTIDCFSPGRVALVTGAAMGIGRAASLYLAEKGMAVAMVDLPGADLDEAVEAVKEKALQAGHHSSGIMAVPGDLSKRGVSAALHETVKQALGPVHFLMNNAVTRTGRGFQADRDQWREAMDVNFWAVVDMVDACLGDLLSGAGDADIPGLIVNVGSKQGITNPPGHPIYNVTKSALKTYSEALAHQLRTEHGDGVSAHLLVPGWTTTGKNEHRPGAWLPAQVIDQMVEGIDANHFYILCPDGEVTRDMDNRRIAWAAGDIIEDRPPLSRWHPDHADRAKKACS